MKRFLCVSVALMTTLLLVACSQEPASSKASSTVQSTGPTTDQSDLSGHRLTAQGAFPLRDGETIEVVGNVVGSSSMSIDKGSVKLNQITLAMPLLLDGIETRVEFPLVVDDQSKVVDGSGAEVARLEQERLVGNTDFMRATVRRTSDGKLVVVVIAPVAGP